MITDKASTQSGIPSATRGRLQLAKPVQTNNAGRVASKQPTNNIGATTLNNASTVIGWNPFQPKGALQEQIDSGAILRHPAAALTPTRSVPNPAGGIQAKPSGIEAGSAPEANKDLVRRYFTRLTQDEQLAFLNEIADGSLKSELSQQAGYQTPNAGVPDHAVMTGDQSVLGNATMPIRNVR